MFFGIHYTAAIPFSLPWYVLSEFGIFCSFPNSIANTARQHPKIASRYSCPPPQSTIVRSF